MTDAAMPNQASQPEQDVAASQQAQVYAPPNAGGSATLDAAIAAGEQTYPQGEPIAQPIASNFSAATGNRAAKTADASTVAGPYAADAEQSEQGKVHLQNNPNPAGEAGEGALPDTDPTGLPLDPQTNLPD